MGHSGGVPRGLAAQYPVPDGHPFPAATYGFLLVLAVFAAQLLLKKRFADAPPTPNTRLENLRGILTAVFAVTWLVTSGLALVWIR